MKQVFLFLVLSLLAETLHSQWSQIGLDIDGEAANDQSGWSVDLSSNGDIVAIGANYNDIFKGHIRVYENINNTWVQMGADIDGIAGNDYFGQSISLSNDGLTVAAGAYGNDGSGNYAGHVRVFTYSLGSWVQVGGDIEGEFSDDRSGWTVDLNSSGNIVAIGAMFNDGNGTNSGHVRVFELIGGTWTQLGSDLDGEAASDRSGRSISLSDDGYRLAIGARDNDGIAGSGSGHVRIYEYTLGSWNQLGSDINGEDANDQSGCAVSLSSDGGTVAIGARNNDGNGANSGHVRVYQYTGGIWNQLGSDIDGEASNDEFGWSVSLSGNGETVAVGGPQNDDGGTSSGHARVYKYIGGIWTQQGSDIDGEASEDESGHSIALSSDGTRLAVGAPFNDDNGSSSGHVRIYSSCSPSTGTDSQTACNSFTWIDGNTYTSNNSTATFTFINGASSGCDSIVTLNLTIEDNTSPIADAATLSDLTAECEITSLTAPTATDNCVGTVTGTHNVTLPITSSTTITWTYDDGNSNTSTQTQEVIIDDVTAPVADIATLADLTEECEVTSLTAPTATDNCEGTITGTHGATLPITSTTTITWTYDDGNGNTATQTQEVIIDDVTAPVADVATLADLTEECEITSLTAPTATDNCAGTITGTHGATLPITSTTTITWTYDDGNGNTYTQTQEVIIDDVTAPVADVATLTDLTDECEITSLTTPTATDNCAGTVTGTHSTTLPITSTTTITWTYDDGNGNTSTQTQEVIITPIDNGVSVVDDVTLSADASGYSYQWVDCDDNNSPISGETNQTFEATANGSYAVVIDNGDCSVTSDCFDITTVSLDKNEIVNINVYPNPTSGLITITSTNPFNTIEVIDVMGKVVRSANFNQVNTYNMSLPEVKGIYLVKISDKLGTKIFRIVKE